MKEAEVVVLKALVRRLRHRAAEVGALSMKTYETAGYAYAEGGTGDEGWQKAYRQAGIEMGYKDAANELELTLKLIEESYNDG